jgi:signal transduction histidine kinase
VSGVLTLDSSPLFCELSNEDRRRLENIAREQQFPAGSQIFKEGDLGDGVYLVKSGLVEISGLLVDAARHVFSQIGPGEIFGEMAVLENKPRSAGAIAKLDSTVYFVPREAMLTAVENSPALAMALLREISNRLREFNRQYLAEVLQAERLTILGRFARSIVHDLKNPLNIIGITAEMAGMEQISSEFKHEARNRIRKQVDRISDLISEILEFTQTSGRSAVVLAPGDYGAFVRQLAEELRPELEVKSVTIELQGSIPEAQVLHDPKRLRRVFYNLIHNATDAMPEGGKIIVRVFAEKDGVITEIEDAGPGVAPEIAGQLFQVFATHGKEHGTGLGLSICKRIIEDHRGTIWARNEPGRGAVFSFKLPFAAEGATDAAECGS